METDWGLAWQVGGIGFGLVFVVLVILAAAIWLTGLVIRKTERGEKETGETKKGA